MSANNSTPVSRVQPKTLADANDQVLAWSPISNQDVIIPVKNLFSNVALNVGTVISVGGANGITINSSSISVNGTPFSGGNGGYAGGDLVPTSDGVSLLGNASNRFLSASVANTITVGNSTINTVIDATSFSGTANAALSVGGVSAANLVSNAQLQSNLANFQTTLGLAANVLSLQSNDATFFGGLPASSYANNGAPVISTSLEVGGSGNNVTINTTAIISGNSTVFSTVNSTAFSGVANNTLNVGTVTAANVVSNAQLVANLANYPLSSTLNATITTAIQTQVPTLTANNANNLGGLPPSAYSNSGAPVISTSLEVGGVGNNVTVNTTAISVGNSTVKTVVNSTSFSGVANNTLNVGTVTAANVVSNAQLVANLTSYQTLAGVSANVTPIVQALVPTLTANNANNLGGLPPSNFANVTTPAISTSLSVGTIANNVTANTTAIIIGNSTINSTVNSTAFSGTANNASNLGGQGAGTFANNSAPVFSANISIGANVHANTSALKVGNTTQSTLITQDTITVSNLVVSIVSANSNLGLTGQVLTSAGPTANAFWANVSAGSNTGGPYGPFNSLAYNNAGTEDGDANLVWNASIAALGVANAVIVGNSTVFSTVNSTAFSGRASTANNANNLGGLPPTSYANITQPVITTTLAVGSNATINTSSITFLSLTGNSTLNASALIMGNTTVSRISNSTIDSFTGVGISANLTSTGLVVGVSNITSTDISVGTATVNSHINSTALFVGNSTVNSVINSTAFSGIVNNTLNIGTTSAANVVSNAQLTANLANYPLTSTLNGTITTAIQSQVPNLTANNANNLGGLPANNYANTTTPVFSSTTQVTDGVNSVTANSTTLSVGNSTVNSTITSTSFSGIANDVVHVNGVAAANVVSNSQLIANLANYPLTSTLNGTITSAITSQVPTLTANNANNLGGLPANNYANTTGPVFTTSVAVGANVVANSSTLAITGTLNTTIVNSSIINFGNTTVNSSMNSSTLSVANIALGSKIIANGSIGSAGQVLVSGGTLFNDSWQTFTSAAIGANNQIPFNNSGIESAEANLAWNTTTATLLVNGTVSASNVAVGARVTANGGIGTAGQVLVSGGATGNANWVTFTAGAVGGNTQIAFNNSGTESGDANLTWNLVSKVLAVGNTTVFTSITPTSLLTQNVNATQINSTSAGITTLAVTTLGATGINVSSTFAVGANVNINPSSLSIGNSTVNSALSATTLVIGNNTINPTTIVAGNSTVNTTINSTSVALGGAILANGSIGIPGQVLTSGGSGANDFWNTIIAGPYGPVGAIAFNNSGAETGDANLTFTAGINPVLSIGTTSNTQITPLAVIVGNSIVNGSNFQTGNSTVFVTTNSTSKVLVGVGTNTVITASNLVIGNTTVFTLSNSTNIQATNGSNNAILNSGTISIGNSISNSVINSTSITVANVIIGFSVIANSALGTHGQVLTSGGGISNDYWSTTTAGGAIGLDTQIAFNQAGSETGDANLIFNYGVTPTLVVGAATNTQIGAGTVTLGNSTVNSVINSTAFSGTVLTANSSAFIGILAAANVVSNAQLIANLANYTLTSGLSIYQTTAGLAANVAKLPANTSAFIGTLAAANVANNSAPVMSVSLGVGANVLLTTTGLSVGNLTVNTVINSTSFSGTANNALLLGGLAAASFANSISPIFTTSVNVGSNVSINTSTLFLGNSTVNTTINSSSLGVSSLTVNGNVTFNGNISSGPGQFNMQGDILPILDNSYYIGQPGNTWIGFFTTMTCGNTSVNSAINSTALFLGNSTVNTTITANVFQSSTSGIASLLIQGTTANATINSTSIKMGNSVLSSTLTATTLTLANSTTSLTINSNAFASQSTANGFTFLPNGLILQWGTILANTISQLYTFPTAHAVNVFSISLQGLGTSVATEVVSFTKTGFNANCGSATAVSIMWQSVGS